MCGPVRHTAAAGHTAAAEADTQLVLYACCLLIVHHATQAHQDLPRLVQHKVDHAALQLQSIPHASLPVRACMRDTDSNNSRGEKQQGNAEVFGVLAHAASANCGDTHDTLCTHHNSTAALMHPVPAGMAQHNVKTADLSNELKLCGECEMVVG